MFWRCVEVTLSPLLDLLTHLLWNETKRNESESPIRVVFAVPLSPATVGNKKLPMLSESWLMWNPWITWRMTRRDRSMVPSWLHQNQHLCAGHTAYHDRWESFEVPQKSRSPFRGLASLRLTKMRWTLFVVKLLWFYSNNVNASVVRIVTQVSSIFQLVAPYTEM